MKVIVNGDEGLVRPVQPIELVRPVPAEHDIDAGTGAFKRRAMNHEVQYGPDYVAKYNQYDCRAMSEVRWDTLRDHCNVNQGFRLLDFGCGNGAFLKTAKDNLFLKPKVAGWDVAGYPLPDIELVHPKGRAWEVVTFFDSLEHIRDADELLASFEAKYLIVSLPWCHAAVMGAEWFEGWKHNRPNEHWWSFDATTLCNLMARHGYKPVFIGNPEDAVRKPDGHLPNILTGVFAAEWV
jgi:hypothetical protein